MQNKSLSNKILIFKLTAPLQIAQLNGFQDLIDVDIIFVISLTIIYNTLQAPFVCTAATLSSAVGKSREIQYQGITIEFSKISPTLFFGYETLTGFYMATPEKALADTFNLMHDPNRP